MVPPAVKIVSARRRFAGACDEGAVEANRRRAIPAGIPAKRVSSDVVVVVVVVVVRSRIIFRMWILGAAAVFPGYIPDKTSKATKAATLEGDRGAEAPAGR